MRRVRYSVAMSLDGYIAGPKGEIDWIVIDSDIDFRALVEAFDTVLLGRKTYEATRQQGGSRLRVRLEYRVLFASSLRLAGGNAPTPDAVLQVRNLTVGSAMCPVCTLVRRTRSLTAEL